MSKKRIIQRLLFPVIRLWAATWRYRGQLPSTSPCIMLMWHEELFPVLRAGAGKEWVGIISPSKDGNFLERLINCWGYRTIRGSASTHDKAVKVLRDTIKLAKDNNKLCIGIDGPRGPRRQVKIGMLMAAQRAAVPLFLVRIKAKGKRFEKAWDKTLLPYPFARVSIHLSDPIHIDKSVSREELEQFGLELNHRLNQLGDD